MKNIEKIEGSNVRFYVEDYRRSSTSGEVSEHQVLIDFGEQEAIDGIEQVINGDSNSISSMMSVTFEENTDWKLSPGSWYETKLSFFQGSELTPVTPEGEGAAFLKYQLQLTSVDRSSVKLSEVNWGDWEGEKELSNLEFRGSPWLNVVNCGQGNWNEVFFENVVLVYDIGASRTFTRNDIQKLVSRRFKCYGNRKVIVVISHWDIDHYQALLECQSSEFNQIDCLIVPSQVPNTLTYKRVRQKLYSENVRIFSLPPKIRRSNEGRKIILKHHSQWGKVAIYRAVSGSSRNQTGIVVTVEGQFRLAILPGDHHYEKVLDAISNTVHKYAVLVVPHHGGHAGRLDVSDWHNKFNFVDCPISVGKNSYKHPLLKYLPKLDKLQGFAPPRTDDFYSGFTPCLFRREVALCTWECAAKCSLVNGDCCSGDICYLL